MELNSLSSTCRLSGHHVPWASFFTFTQFNCVLLHVYVFLRVCWMLMCVYEIVIFRKQSFSGLNMSPHALPMLFECCYKSSVLVTVTFHCLTMPGSFIQLPVFSMFPGFCPFEPCLSIYPSCLWMNMWKSFLCA